MGTRSRDAGRGLVRLLPGSPNHSCGQGLGKDEPDNGQKGRLGPACTGPGCSAPGRRQPS